MQSELMWAAQEKQKCGPYDVPYSAVADLEGVFSMKVYAK